VVLRDGELDYDTLIVATGSSHHYFGHEEWSEVAPGLKTVEDALDIRRRILLAFEAAERETDVDQRRAWMTFVIVGGGPTGVELAGAIGELAHATLRNDFRNINPAETQILLLEGAERILPSYTADLSARAEAALARLGVTVHPHSLVTDIQSDTVKVIHENQVIQIQARTILWAAGMQASPLGKVLAARTQAQLDRSGRVIVEPDLSLPDYPNIFVIGDLAHYAHQDGRPLPGVAPVAIQQGHYVARLIHKRLGRSPASPLNKAQSHLQGTTPPLRGTTPPLQGTMQGIEGEVPFRYRDKGSLAVIGRNVAIAQIGPLKFAGFPAWLLWVFVHIGYLIEFDHKLLVLIQWAWNYFTRKRGARLITGQDAAQPTRWLRMSQSSSS
jgi:NADH dehydrogenase